ncbi:TorF family putative porin [Pseudomonas sp. App30]|uniref:TorF family putative porin n=1 Tax=Pseudomonas sp. App30 TaxID=3068990 RepID=UPI003A81013B
MLKPSLLFAATLLAAQCASAQPVQLQRDLGDYSLQIGTNPARSMAQGLVKPATSDTVHGGVDLSSDSGWYFGQWSPSMGLTASTSMEIDTYTGFKSSFTQSLGYEVGVIHYTFPDLATNDSHEVYAGLTVLSTRFGAAFSDDPGRHDSTLFADFGHVPLLDFGVRVKVGDHQLDTPYTIGDGSEVRGFSDWSVQLSRAFMGVDLNLIYSGSSLGGASCEAYSGQNSWCDGTLVLQAQRSLF